MCTTIEWHRGSDCVNNNRVVDDSVQYVQLHL
jgi:hypothetical protein